PFDFLEASCDQRAIAFVRLTATTGAIGAIGPATTQRIRGITPTKQSLETRQVRSDIEHATELTALVLAAYELADTPLTSVARAIELFDIVRRNELVLAIEETLEARQCIRFIGEQSIEMLAAHRLIHGLFLRAYQIRFHAHQLVGNAFRFDFVRALFDRE